MTAVKQPHVWVSPCLDSSYSSDLHINSSFFSCRIKVQCLLALKTSALAEGENGGRWTRGAGFWFGV